MENQVLAEIYPVSAQQATILQAQDRLEKTLAAHALLAFSESLNRSQLELALTKLCERHEVLRTQYKKVPEFKLPVQEVFSDSRFQLRPAEGETREQTELLAALQLAQTPVVASVFDKEVLITLSLASVDERSLKQISQELRQLYRGEVLLDFDGLQYVDYATWQSDLSREDIGLQARAYWQALYADNETTERLPFERNIEPLPSLERCVLMVPLAKAISGIAEHTNLNEEEVLLFLWGAFLARLGQRERLLVAFHTDRRSESLEQTIGHFNTRLPVAFAVQQQRSVRENLEIFSRALEQSHSWQDCLNELDMLGEKAVDLKSINYGFSYRVDGAHTVALQIDNYSFEKLHLHAVAGDEVWQLELSYQPESFHPEMPSVWLAQFTEFVLNVAENSDQIIDNVALENAEQNQRLQKQFDRCRDLSPSDDELLHRLFENAARQFPDRIAVHVDGREMSYAELELRANRLASVLIERGIKADDIVAVYGGRSIEFITALLGILKAGGTYLPLDPAYPAERLSFMLADTKTRCLIALQPVHEEVALKENISIVRFDDEPLSSEEFLSPANVSNPSNLAYVIYTSGSTGTPKGVMVSHANACVSTKARFSFYGEPVRNFLMLSSFSFDSSVAGIFWTLGQGGTLYLPREDDHKDAFKIARLIAEYRISHFLALPSLYAEILKHLQDAQPHYVIVAGEACSLELSKRHQQLLPKTVLVNEYGPSESTVWCSAFAIGNTFEDERVPIGYPIAGARLYILDNDVELAARGREGELYVGGYGLARGYLNRPGLTASRFLPDPFSEVPGARIYRSGDLVRGLPEGTVDYLGRVDFQLKIRGHRIELGEIEERLAQLDGVLEAAVVARETANGKQLAAYVVLNSLGAEHLSNDREARENDLLHRLRKQLPEYMVPAFVRALDRFPKMPNGKLNRNALAELEVEARAFIAPRTELEIALAGVWKEMLQVDRVGIHDSFFALGGHSLLATRIRSRIQLDFNLTLPLRVFLECETIELLARQIELHRGSQITDEKIDALEALFDVTENV